MTSEGDPQLVAFTMRVMPMPELVAWKARRVRTTTWRDFALVAIDIAAIAAAVWWDWVEALWEYEIA